MKLTPAITLAFLFSSASQTFAAGGMTIQNLPNEPEQPNPVCRDADGRLANCTPAAGVDRMYLSPIAVDGDGNVLGTVIGATLNTNVILSTNNYQFLIETDTGEISFLYSTYYDQENCQGNMYVLSYLKDSSYVPPDYSQGKVFRGMTRINNNIYYIPHDAKKKSILIKSNIEQYSSCYNNESIRSVILIQPNIPNITGVANKGTPDNPYALPITLRRP